MRCLHELFEVQAALRPTKVAVTCGHESMTYAALDARANQLARHLRRMGVRPGGLVAIYMERSIQAIVAMLACLKAGGGYVPIDPVCPLERVRFVLDNAGVTVVLTEQALSAAAAEAGLVFPGTTILVDGDREAIAAQSTARLSPADGAASEHDLCYVIYTSGTTGRPKGVMTEHRSVVHFVSAFNEACQITTHDRVFQNFSTSFDGSVEEIWMALAHGASLVIGTAGMVRIGSEVARVLNQHRVTVFSTVPRMLSTIDVELPSVRLLIVGGERCSPALVNRWTRPGRRLLNVYGPTEATGNTTVAVCLPGRPITIGRPLRGYHVRVLDEARRPVLDGLSGELYIGGVGLARGYLGQPALSAQSFVPNPDGDAEASPRLYRTGDRVRWTASGELDFMGRIDEQVKIRELAAPAQAMTADDPAGDDRTPPRASSEAVFEPLPRSIRTAVPALQAASQYLIDGVAAAPVVAVVALGLSIYQGELAVGWLVLLSALLLIGAYPVLLLLSIAAKWLVIGRHKPGRYPLWGFYYFRCWLVGRLQALCSPAPLAGTPFPDVPATRGARRRPILFGLYHLLLIYAMEVFLLLTIVPAAALVLTAFLKGGLGWRIASVLAAVPVSILSFCLLVAAAKRIVLRLLGCRIGRHVFLESTLFSHAAHEASARRWAATTAAAGRAR